MTPRRGYRRTLHVIIAVSWLLSIAGVRPLTATAADTTVTHLQVAFSTTGPCQVTTPSLHADGSTHAQVSLTGTGTCAVTASQAGDAAYAAAPPVTQMFTVAPAATTLTLGSLAPIPYHDSVTLAATVAPATVAGSVASGTVAFAIDGTTVGSASIGSNGLASTSVTVTQAPGTHTVTATFTSSNPNLKDSVSALSATLTVSTEDVTLTYIGDTTGDFHDAVTLKALLLEDGDTSVPLGGKSVTLSLGTQSCTAVSNSSGVASCVLTLNQHPASVTAATASFAGNADYTAASSATVPFTGKKEETNLSYTGAKQFAAGTSPVVSALLTEDGATPLAGKSVQITIGSGTLARICSGTTTGAGIATCTLGSVSAELGNAPVTASFGGDGDYQTVTDATQHAVVYSYVPKGAFTLGDTTAQAAVGTSTPINYWGPHWSKANTLSTGIAPNSFFGYARTLSVSPPTCGATWSTTPGASSLTPPINPPAYMAVVIASHITQAGNTISGNVVKIGIVKTGPGGLGTGTLMTTFCPGSGQLLISSRVASPTRSTRPVWSLSRRSQRIHRSLSRHGVIIPTTVVRRLPGSRNLTPFTLRRAPAGATTGTTAQQIQFGALAEKTFGDAPFQISATSVTAVITTGGLPPDPSTVAPPNDQTVATTIGVSTAFLYTGPNPIQTGVAPGTIDPIRVAVLKGTALDRDNNPLAGVAITILHHPEFGQTLTRADGRFDLAVNGGGQLTVNYLKDGFFPVQRQVDAPWQNYAAVPDAVLITQDSKVTMIDPASTAPIQVAQGNPVTDADGTRQATLFFPQGTTAMMTLPDGSTQPMTTLHVRATEYTVGPNGPERMPAALPPTSGYTYAADYSVDEAQAAGATGVTFNHPIVSYLQNFLNFPVGTAVPVGLYDKLQGKWMPENNGRVIKILSITGGMADLDLTGNGTPADATALAALGITDAERTQLALSYAAGATLWRMLIPHFSSCDYNWPYGPPPGAGNPPSGDDPLPDGPKPKPDPCKKQGSIIGCLAQSLGENVGVAGTPFSLHYESARSATSKDAFQITLPLTGPTLPGPVVAVLTEISIAGQTFEQRLPPTPNQTFTFTWNGKDTYGRPMQGSQPFSARFGYVYKAVYTQPADFSKAWAAVSDSHTINVARGEIVTWQDSYSHGMLGTWRTIAQGLGGWSLDAQHVYDPNARTLYAGTGEARNSDALTFTGPVLSPAASSGGQCFPTTAACGDGGPAIKATFRAASRLAVDASGVQYIADSQANRIRKIGTDGIITTVVGTGVMCTSSSSPCGDGGPATQAQLNDPQGLAVAPDGTLYIADSNDNRIRRVSPDGVITTFAGDGSPTCGPPTFGPCFGGDGGPASQAKLRFPSGVSVGPDGSLYIADTNNNRIRRVATDGTINTEAGDGSPDCFSAFVCFGGDDGPAARAHLFKPVDIVAAPDGTLYISDAGNIRIRRVGQNGIITTLAGDGTICQYVNGISCGDGLSSKQARLAGPDAMALAPNGTLYIADKYTIRLRAIHTNGIIQTAAGGNTSGSSSPNGPATASDLNGIDGVAVAPDGRLLLDNSFSVSWVGPTLSGLASGERLIPSTDGSEVYVFDPSGRHLRTLDALTGALRLLFDYDNNGYLAHITDAVGNITTVERDSVGSPTTIVAPGGQRTTFALDNNGYLSSIADPGGGTYRLITTGDGALTSLTDPNGRVHSFQYDNLGRLTLDQNPAGGSSTLVRTDAGAGSKDFSVAVTTAMGRTTTYGIQFLPNGDRQFTTTDPNGGQTTIILGTDGVGKTSYPDGSTVAVTQGPDPRWGMLVPVATSIVSTTPGGVVQTVDDIRTATLTTAGDPLSLTNMTDTLSLDGRSYVTNYNASTRTLTRVTPAGRATSLVLDNLGRPHTIIPGTGIDPVTATYNAQGNLSQVVQGGRSVTYTYDAMQRLIARQNAGGAVVQYGYDAADRLTSMIAPTGATTRVSYDAAGNAASVTMPSGAVHTLAATSIDELAAYTPPSSAGYRATYTADGAVAGVTLPSGRTESYSYDSGGRPTQLSYGGVSDTFTYGSVTDQVTGVTRTDTNGTQSLNMTYDGFLPTSADLQGTTIAHYDYSYLANTLSRVDLKSGSDHISFNLSRDADNLVTGYGPFTFDRGGPGGLTSGIRDGTLAMSIGFDSFGRTASRNQTVNQASVYNEALTYDANGLIVRKVETTGGTSHTYDYAYDGNGQLTSVKRDGTTTEQYTYDGNANRTSRTRDSNPVQIATYDSQDRLNKQGDTTYSFDSDGYLVARGSTDTFQYSPRGELLSATVAGSTVTYTYDGIGRRIARTDGGGTTQYLYGRVGNPYQITEVRDPAGVLTSLFYDNSGLLYAMQRGTNRYYVATDQVGTPHVVTDSTGAVVKNLSYDSYGTLLSDSAPGFVLPIGFAGGLADSTTGLVHFGHRDYDPIAGRWTARDPGIYDGGQPNLYSYVANSPVGFRDPTGLFCIGGSAYDGIGGGADLCITDKGLSVCAELGVGVGEEASLRPDGQLASDFFGASLEGQVGISGVLSATAGLSQNLLDPCTGTEANLNLNAGGANTDVVKGKGKDITSLKGQDREFFGVKGPLSDHGGKGLGKAAVEGKAVLKACSTTNW